MLSGTSFIGAADGTMMIRCPRKKMSFCFNHPCDPDVRLRSPEKELVHNGQKAINPFDTIICPK
jgi:hypothetical protein